MCDIIGVKMENNDEQGFRELICSNKDCGLSKNTGKRSKPRLLGKSLMMPGSVLEIKCPKCGTVTQFISKPIE